MSGAGDRDEEWTQYDTSNGNSRDRAEDQRVFFSDGEKPTGVI